MVVGVILSACLAEQTNPLILNGTCNDGLMNQDEEAVDCGGVCKDCNIVEPVVSPCKASLKNNVLTVDGLNTSLKADDYSCTQESDYFKIYILKNNKEIIIEIYETTLPKIGTVYPLIGWWDAKEGYASIKITEFYSYNSTSGSLYLAYENNKWIVEICSVDLIGQGSSTRELSGRILCDW